MRVFILGAGRSGLAAARFGLSLGDEVFLFDDNEKNLAGREFEEIVFFGAWIVPTERRFDCLDICNTVVVSPGVPRENELIKYAENRGKKVMSELEYGFGVCKAPVAAVTGTNGKTTVTALTAHLLSAGGLSAWAGGNIGLPFCDFADDISAQEIAVLEVSSFMLEAVFSFRPRVAVLLNITPDHLDRHKTMEEYGAQKLKIFARQTASDYAVLNRGDTMTAQYAKKIKAKKYWFSADKKTNGAHIRGSEIYFGEEHVCAVSAVKLLGKHNLENALAAVTTAKILGIESGDIEKGLNTFRAVSHRLEFVAEKDGVNFINDSKATNIDSTLKAIVSVSGFTALILGGSDKGYEYDGLFSALPEHIKHCIFIGAVTEKLCAAADRCGYSSYTKCGSLGEAIERAAALCRENGGGTVLLSPASASFDSFKNFEHRGEVFKKMVEEYVSKNAKKV